MSRKKVYGDNWWAKRWNGVLDSYGWENRLTRGRSYARRGKVLSINVDPGVVTAMVEGSRPKPYSVRIKFDKLPSKDWDEVLKVMSDQASYAALLLAGEMPKNIEEAFDEATIPLFPEEHEIEMKCSCPDWALPCKHIAAVFYVMGDMFDEDPFLLFHLRGRSKDMIMKGLRERRVEIGNISKVEEEHQTSTSADPPTPDTDISPEKFIENFWVSGEGLSSFKVNMAPPKLNGSLLKTHGPPAFITDKKTFNRLMEELYTEVSEKAMEVAYDLEEENEI